MVMVLHREGAGDREYSARTDGVRSALEDHEKFEGKSRMPVRSRSDGGLVDRGARSIRGATYREAVSFCPVLSGGLRTTAAAS
jgi:hypothetical protein